MFLRKLRWIVAGLAIVAAVCVSPAQSKADVQVLVEELDAGGAVVASQYTTSTSALVFYNFTGIYFSGGGTVTTNSASASTTSSLTPSFSGQLTPAFDVTQDHKLRITVTDDKFTTSGLAGTLRNDAGASSGFSTGSVQVDTFSRIFNPDPLTPASSTTQLANGVTVAGPTATASASQPGPDTDDRTETGVSALPSPYAIQQTILISFAGAIPAGATFGGTGGASVQPPATAVPAPGGLALALAALPLLGLRRTLRKRAAV